mmetsp:Transcript_38937/g.39349  ORF Transcript_38937/g.39349 Transcript_38937/m.39349 type:complete len:143 (-) Transcript_38937:216-644(-)
MFGGVSGFDNLATGGGGRRNPWSIEHLKTEEPDAILYLNDNDDEDQSTLASTPSVRATFKNAERNTTIVRCRGEPTDIIFSVQKRKGAKKVLIEKFQRTVKFFIMMCRLLRNKRSSNKTKHNGIYISNDLDGTDINPTAVLV